MDYVKFSADMPECSRIWLGGWSFGGGNVWGKQSDKDSEHTIRAAFDAGINVFDTAERYNEGRSEEILGKSLAPIRDKVIIASKVRKEYLDYEGITLSCNRSLKRLKTDYLDMYQIHWPNHAKLPEEVFGNLVKLKEQGKIRSYGICNYGAHDIQEIPDSFFPLSNQLAYNLFFRALEYEIITACKKRSIPVVAYSPLAQGLLTGKYSSLENVPKGIATTRLFPPGKNHNRHNEPGCKDEIEKAWQQMRKLCVSSGYDMKTLSLQWILQKPYIHSVVLGARTQVQLQENLDAYTSSVDPFLFREMDVISSEIKKKIGPNADMWCTDSRIR